MDDFQRKIQEHKKLKREIDQMREKSPLNQVLKAISGLTSEVKNLQTPKKVKLDTKALGKAFDNLSKEVASLNAIEFPDNSDKIVTGITKELSSLQKEVSGLNKSLSKMTVNVNSPEVNPQIKVEKPDLSKLETLMSRDLPELLVNLVDSIPQPESAKSELGDIKNTLQQILDKPTPVPAPVTTVGLKHQGQEVSSANPLPVAATVETDNTEVVEELKKIRGFDVPEYDEIALTYVAEGNGVGEIEDVIYKKENSTVATLTLSYNEANNLSNTSISYPA